jgi:hypothetical protein
MFAHQALNNGVIGSIGQSTAIQRTEIDSEVGHLGCHIDALESSLGDLQSALYQVLGPDLKNEKAGPAPTPVMNSPLGGAMHAANARLDAIVRAMAELRGRIQL